MSNKWSQSDYVSENDKLRKEANVHESFLRTNSKEFPQRPNPSTDMTGTGILADYDALSAHVAKLRSLVNLSAKTENDNKLKQNSDKNCELCSGTTRCSQCNGTGYNPGSTAANSCTVCNGSASQKTQVNYSYTQFKSANGLLYLPYGAASLLYSDVSDLPPGAS